MNLHLKAVYYCATSGRAWGKGLTIEAAKKAAGYKKARKEQYRVWAALFDSPTNEELENLRQCITADQVGGGPEFYKDNRTDEDNEMIDRLLVGWLVVETNVK